jgi:hypothetical protein
MTVACYCYFADSSDGYAAYCETETFHATCALDEVIVMTRALYGRMKISRCVKLDYGHLGCVADVLELADARCSGRRRCEIRIPDPEFARNKPCPEDLKPYLEAGYKCVKGKRQKSRSLDVEQLSICSQLRKQET